MEHKISVIGTAAIYMSCLLVCLASVAYFALDIHEGPLIDSGFISGLFLGVMVGLGSIKLGQDRNTEDGKENL